MLKYIIHLHSCFFSFFLFLFVDDDDDVDDDVDDDEIVLGNIRRSRFNITFFCQ